MTQKNLVLIGSGAVENAWGPVRLALRRHFKSLPEGEENTAFANLVFQLRWGAQAVAKGTSLGASPEQVEELKRSLAATVALYRELKEALATELKAATQTGNLHPRDSAQKLFDRFAKGEEAMVVTTNWDVSIEVPFPPSTTLGVQYLHGNVKHPATLYLPSEGVDEPYRDATENGPELEVVRKASLKAMDLVAACDSLIVYGLSISPLDSELGVVLGAGAQRRKTPFQLVAVVNPDPLPILRRLQFYLGPQRYAVLGPGDL